MDRNDLTRILNKAFYVDVMALQATLGGGLGVGGRKRHLVSGSISRSRSSG